MDAYGSIQGFCLSHHIFVSRHEWLYTAMNKPYTASYGHLDVRIRLCLGLCNFIQGFIAFYGRAWPLSSNIWLDFMVLSANIPT